MEDIKAVFWDLDGTLAETEMYGHRISFNYSFKKHGINWNWSKETYRQLLKIPGGKNRIQRYSEKQCYKLSNSLIDSIHNEKQIYYSKLVSEGEVPIRNGVFRLINEMKKKDIQQWIVTTSSRAAVEPLIKKFFSISHNTFEGMITFEDVSRLKPDPEAYLLAITRSGLPPNNCVVIEDSHLGLLAAKRAHLSCLVTLPSWKSSFEEDMKIAEAIVTTLGNEADRCEVLHGPDCENGLVTLKYLNRLSG